MLIVMDTCIMYLKYLHVGEKKEKMADPFIDHNNLLVWIILYKIKLQYICGRQPQYFVAHEPNSTPTRVSPKEQVLYLLRWTQPCPVSKQFG